MTLSITLIGGPTALIEIDGFRILTDPTFDAPGAYQLPHVKLEKLSGPALEPELDLPGLDFVAVGAAQLGVDGGAAAAVAQLDTGSAVDPPAVAQSISAIRVAHTGTPRT